jgi:hypothetical protein
MNPKALDEHIAALHLRQDQSSDAAEQEKVSLLLAAYMSLHTRLTGRRSLFARDGGRRRASVEAMGLQTALTDCHKVTISISQLFKVQDLLLTEPSELLAANLHGVVNDVGKLRHALSPSRGIKIEGLGTLEPVAQIGRRVQESFWYPAIPDLREPAFKTDPPLTMIPFELSPFPYVESMKLSPESWVAGLVKDTLGPATQQVEVTSVRGSLRIYPTGVGVVRLSTELEFSGSILVELIANVARAIEDTVFVDPEGRSRKAESFLSELVDLVAAKLFKDAGGFDRRWRPPDAVIHLRQGEFVPEEHTRELAYTMSLSPGNRETLTSLRSRIEQKLRLPGWLEEGALAVPGRRVLMLVRSIDAWQKRGASNLLLKFLAETHELTSVALHTYRVFAEDLQSLRENGWPDDDWLPGTDNFARLQLLIDTIRRATRAVHRISHHLRRTGRGMLTSLAREVWDADAGEVIAKLNEELLHVGLWIQASGLAGEPEMGKLATAIASIASMQQPFAIRSVSLESTQAQVEEVLENEILDGHQRIEDLLAAENPDFAAIDAAILSVEEARRRLFAPLDEGLVEPKESGRSL